MWRRVVYLNNSDVSDKPTASIFAWANKPVLFFKTFVHFGKYIRRHNSKENNTISQMLLSIEHIIAITITTTTNTGAAATTTATTTTVHTMQLSL